MIYTLKDNHGLCVRVCEGVGGCVGGGGSVACRSLYM